jgi:hypothetical protein
MSFAPQVGMDAAGLEADWPFAAAFLARPSPPAACVQRVRPGSRERVSAAAHRRSHQASGSFWPEASPATSDRAPKAMSTRHCHHRCARICRRGSRLALEAGSCGAVCTRERRRQTCVIVSSCSVPSPSRRNKDMCPTHPSLDRRNADRSSPASRHRPVPEERDNPRFSRVPAAHQAGSLAGAPSQD